MGLDDDLDAEVGNLPSSPPPDYGDGPKDSDADADLGSDAAVGSSHTAGPADLSDSSGNPADAPDLQKAAHDLADADTPGDLAVDPKGVYFDHDNDGLPDPAFRDYAGEPVPDIPAPVTPDTPTDEAQRRVSYERLVNEQWTAFVANNQVAFIDHMLAGRDVKLVAYDSDGYEYDPDDDRGDLTAEQSHDAGPNDGAVVAAVDHDAIVAADPDSTDLRSETDNPSVQ